MSIYLDEKNPEKHKPFDDASPDIVAYVRYLEVIAGKSPNTAFSYYCDLRNFSRFMKRRRGLVTDDTEIKDIDPKGLDTAFWGSVTKEDVYEYLYFLNSECGNKKSSTARRLASLHGFYDYLVNQVDLLQENPTASIKPPKALSGSLVDFLSHGGSKTYYRTWNNVARWINMVLNGTYWKFVPKSALDDMVRNIAVINLKKCSGSAHASAKVVRQAARQDADRLKRQIQLYEPDIILTGGWGLVSNILHDEILADDAEWVKPNGQTALWYYTSCSVRSEKETLVVSMPHPNRAAKCWTLELEKILRETGRS